MAQNPEELPKAADNSASDLWLDLRHWLIAGLIGVGVITGGTTIVNLQAGEIESRQQYDLLQMDSNLRTRLNRELNSVLYLTNGLSSYLAVRGNALQSNEAEAVLAALYRDSRHVRNFGIAIGHTLTYIYPVKGNEKVLGLHYPDVPAQWPDVERVIRMEQPVLIGPLKLLQGGNGLIYRVPVYVSGKYWGLVSTVIDSDSLLRSVLSESDTSTHPVAVRSMNGDVFWEDATLFTEPSVWPVNVDIPGGKWVFAIRNSNQTRQTILQGFYVLIWALGLMLSWFAYTVLVQRANLARLALHDALTGLPNRLLVEDRVDHAMTILRRDSDHPLLLLFIDLDGFKEVNDVLGHKAGDYVLQQTAQRISMAVRDTDTVSRWGGDEFIVFMEQVDPAMTQAIIDKLRRAIEMPIAIGSNTASISASIGAAVPPADGSTLAALIRAADERMYNEKRQRKSDAGVL